MKHLTVWSAPYTMHQPKLSDSAREGKLTGSFCHWMFLTIERVNWNSPSYSSCGWILSLPPWDHSKQPPLFPRLSSSFRENPLELSWAFPLAWTSLVPLGLEAPLPSGQTYSYVGLSVRALNISTWNDHRTSPRIINLLSPWQPQRSRATSKAFGTADYTRWI